VGYGTHQSVLQRFHSIKLGVVDAINFSRFSNQSLAVELLIRFPIHLQIGFRWT
jgi:hypothetical protein